MCTRPIGITLFAKCCPSHVAKCNLWPGADQFVMMVTRCWPGADLDHLRACCASSHLPCFIQAQSSTSCSAVCPVLCLEAVSVLSSGFNFGYHTCQHSSPEIGRCFCHSQGRANPIFSGSWHCYEPRRVIFLNKAAWKAMGVIYSYRQMHR